MIIVIEKKIIKTNESYFINDIIRGSIEINN
jgi:hypothetical protein